MSRTITAIAASAFVFFATAGLAGAQERVVGKTPVAAEQSTDQSTADGPSPAQGTIAAPVRPQQGDPGGGGQGRQTLAVVAVPDLLLVDAFQLATKTIPWGTSAIVPASAASSSQRGACGFRYKYVTRNQGGAASGATTNRIHRDAQNGPVLASNVLPALAPAATAVSDGHLWLKPGTWMLYVHADDPKAVAESDEANNLRRVKVTVEGKCG